MFLVAIDTVLCCLVPLLLVSGGIGLLTSIGLGSWALIFISLAALGIGTYLFIKKNTAAKLVPKQIKIKKIETVVDKIKARH